jgi:polyisoprenoid-binding protein YceI
MKNAPLLLLASAAVLIGGLAVSFRAPAPAAEPRPAAAESYAVDSSHTIAMFKTRHLGISWFYGFFRKVEGSFELDTANPSVSSVNITIDAGSVDTNDPARDRHVRSPDFLAAKQFKTLTFESKKVEVKGGGAIEPGAVLLVTGDFTMRGKTETLTIEVEMTGAGNTPIPKPGTYRTGFQAKFSINMRDYGFKFLVDRDNSPVGPDVEITLSVEGIRG